MKQHKPLARRFSHLYAAHGTPYNSAVNNVSYYSSRSIPPRAKTQNDIGYYADRVFPLLPGYNDPLKLSQNLTQLIWTQILYETT